MAWQTEHSPEFSPKEELLCRTQLASLQLSEDDFFTTWLYINYRSDLTLHCSLQCVPQGQGNSCYYYPLHLSLYL